MLAWCRYSFVMTFDNEVYRSQYALKTLIIINILNNSLYSMGKKIIVYIYKTVLS